MSRRYPHESRNALERAELRKPEEGSICLSKERGESLQHLVLHIFCMYLASSRTMCSDSAPPWPSGLHLSDRRYAYLCRRIGQHRPACSSLTHYYDILPAGKANTPLASSEKPSLRPPSESSMERTPGRAVCGCETLIAPCCKRLKMEINDKPRLLMNHISRVFFFFFT